MAGDLLDIFEIVDYTAVSPWEKLIDDAEKAVRKFLRADAEPGAKPSGVSRVDLCIGERPLILSFHKLPHGLSKPVNSSLMRTLEQTSPDRVPSVMQWLLSSNFDFEDDAHVLHARYGIPSFFLLTPHDTGYSHKISVSEAKMLLGALAIAAANAEVDIPMFVQVRESALDQFVGSGAGIGWQVQFTGTHLFSTPKAYTNISRLSSLFKSKFRVQHDVNVFVSVRFGYMVGNWFQNWAARTFPPVEAHFQELVRPPLGTRGEVINGIALECTWSHFREDAVVDNSSFSELDPREAPKWVLSLQRVEEAPKGKLETLLRWFHNLLDLDQNARDVIGPKAFRAGDDAAQSGRDALAGIAGTRADALAGELLANVGKAVKLGSAVRRRFNLDDFDLAEKDLSAIMSLLCESETGLDVTVHADEVMTECKRAPLFGLVDATASCLAMVNYYSGGPRSMIKVWEELVSEIRRRWDTLTPLPRMEPADRPDFGMCLIHQKLQLINACIDRQQKRNILRQEHRSTQGHALEDDAQDSDGTTEDNDASDEDDEFLDCEDGDDAVNDSLQGIVGIAKASGIKEVHPSLRLLDHDIAMNVPHLQDPGPVTEDMLMQQMERLEEMGDSHEAAALRAEQQSLGLMSDMQAFKAANPQCCLQDFIRWHSPRDWMTDETGKGYLSERMSNPESIWHKLWDEAEPIPVARQAPLFDITTEVERALLYLENLTIGELSAQLLPSLFNSGFNALYHASQASPHLPAHLKTLLESLRHLSSGLGRTREDDLDLFEEIIVRFAQYEREWATYKCLLHILGEDQFDLCAELAANNSCLVLAEAQRRKLHELFQHYNDVDAFSTPQTQEYILRTVTPGCSHRMYCSIQENHFVVSGAFSTSSIS
eukprot:m.29745 g.29745  ORF g.29745 m.29745 type:complete len:883 (-) comp9202_c0_seq2:329-2977(-)